MENQKIKKIFTLAFAFTALVASQAVAQTVELRSLIARGSGRY